VDSTKTITHVGLCAGYGGIELGLKRVIPNLRTIALCEIEAFAIANLVAKMEAGLMDPAPIWPDLKTFPWESFRDRVDILTGGYPCQPFSSAGKRAGKDDPRHLWPWIADGIASMRPSICFFENVEGHISLGLSNVIEDLGRMGYRTTWGIFSAAEVGAPHQRKRVFILANRNDEGLERWNRSILSERTNERTSWPSRPSIPQHSWEPPRVVISMENTISQRGWSQGGDVIHERRSTSETRREGVQATTGWSTGATISNHQSTSRDGGEGEAAIVGDAKVGQGHRRESGDMGLEASQGGRGNDAVDVTSQAMENTIRSGGEEPSAQPADLSPESSGRDTESLGNANSLDRGTSTGGWINDTKIGSAGEELGDTESSRAYGTAAPMAGEEHQEEGGEPQARDIGQDAWNDGDGAAEELGQTQPSLGGDPDGDSSRLDYAKLCVSGDNRTDELRLLGNGVVPATAELAFRTLFSSLAGDP